MNCAEDFWLLEGNIMLIPSPNRIKYRVCRSDCRAEPSVFVYPCRRSGHLTGSVPQRTIGMDLPGKPRLIARISNDRRSFYEICRFSVPVGRPAAPEPSERLRRLPNKPFLYKLPCAGQRPMTFSVDRPLPQGLCLDRVSGVISGICPIETDEQFLISAENSLGRCEKKQKFRRL